MTEDQAEVLEVEVVEAGAPADIGDDLAEMFDGLGEEATSADCWRRAEKPPRKWGFLDNLEVGDFSLALIAERHGGGDYQVRVKGPDGKYMKGTTRTFRIEGPAKDVPRQAEAEEPAGELATLTVLLQEIRAELQGRRAAGVPVENPMAMALELSKAMREAAAEAAQQVRDTIGGASGSDPFDMLERIMDLQERLGGGGGTDSTVNMLGRELLTVFRKNREGEGQGQAHRKAAPATAGPGSASTAADRSGSVPPPPPPDPNRPPWVGLLEPWMSQLTELAVRGRDPFTYARVIQDQLSDRALEALAYVVAGTAFADEFYLHFPDALGHKPWFDDLLAALREDLVEENYENDPETPETPPVDPAAAPGPDAPEPDAAGAG